MNPSKTKPMVSHVKRTETVGIERKRKQKEKKAKKKSQMMHHNERKDKEENKTRSPPNYVFRRSMPLSFDRRERQCNVVIGYE
jgi:hypothetical protein